MGKGWNAISTRKNAIPESPLRVLVWHTHQGVLVERRDAICSNPCYTHWRWIDDTAWVSAAERMPKQADADIYGCVVAKNRWGDVMMIGWWQFRSENIPLVAWQKPPAPPMAKPNKGGTNQS